MKWCHFPLATHVMDMLTVGSWPQMRAGCTFYEREKSLLILCNGRLDIPYMTLRSHIHGVTTHKKGAKRHEGPGSKKIRVQLSLLEE
jgi:hypothetical protein